MMKNVEVSITAEWIERGVFSATYTLIEDGRTLVRKHSYSHATYYYALYKILMKALVNVHDAVVTVTADCEQFLDELENNTAPPGNLKKYLRELQLENNLQLVIKR